MADGHVDATLKVGLDTSEATAQLEKLKSSIESTPLNLNLDNVGKQLQSSLSKGMSANNGKLYSNLVKEAKSAASDISSTMAKATQSGISGNSKGLDKILNDASKLGSYTTYSKSLNTLKGLAGEAGDELDKLSKKAYESANFNQRKGINDMLDKVNKQLAGTDSVTQRAKISSNAINSIKQQTDAISKAFNEGANKVKADSDKLNAAMKQSDYSSYNKQFNALKGMLGSEGDGLTKIKKKAFESSNFDARKGMNEMLANANKQLVNASGSDNGLSSQIVSQVNAQTDAIVSAYNKGANKIKLSSDKLKDASKVGDYSTYTKQFNALKGFIGSDGDNLQKLSKQAYEQSSFDTRKNMNDKLEALNKNLVDADTMSERQSIAKDSVARIKDETQQIVAAYEERAKETKKARQKAAEEEKEPVYAKRESGYSQYAEVTNLMAQNTAMNEAYRERAKWFKDQYKGIMTGEKPMEREKFEELNAQLVGFKREMKRDGQNGKNFVGQFSDNFKKYFSWISAVSVMFKGLSMVKNGFQNIVGIDTAMVELKKVANGTSKEFDNIRTSSNKVAKELGSSTKAVIEQTAAYAQLGYSIKDSQKLAKTSSIFATISPDMNEDQATESLVSTMKAYKISASDALDGVASKVNAVGNAFSANNGAIAEILKRSSASMAAANNSLDQTIALGTAAQEVVQNAEVVGTALKSSAMNARDAKKVSNVEAITGVSAYADEERTRFKSTYDYYADLQKVWGKITDAQKAAVTQNLFGKRNANVGMAIFSNWSQAEKALATSQGSKGSAMKEFGKATDSLEFKLNALKETGTGMWMDILNAKELKQGLDLLNGLGKVLATITGTIHNITGGSILGEILGIGSVISSFKGASLVGLNKNSSILNITKSQGGLFSNLFGRLGKEWNKTDISFGSSGFKDLFKRKKDDLTPTVFSDSSSSEKANENVKEEIKNREELNSMKEEGNALDEKNLQTSTSRLENNKEIANVNKTQTDTQQPIVDGSKIGKDIGENAGNSASGSIGSALASSGKQIGANLGSALLSGLMGAGIGMAISGIFSIADNLINKSKYEKQDMNEAYGKWEEANEQSKAATETLKKSVAKRDKLKARLQEDPDNTIVKTELKSSEEKVQEQTRKAEKKRAEASKKAADSFNKASETVDKYTILNKKEYGKLLAGKEKNTYFDSDISNAGASKYQVKNSNGAVLSETKISGSLRGGNMDIYNLLDRFDRNLNTTRTGKMTDEDRKETKNRLKKNMDEFSDVLERMKPRYDEISKKSADKRTASERQDYNTYNSLRDTRDMIQKSIDPTKYYNEKFDELFNSKNLEYTKEQLADMVKMKGFDEQVKGAKNLQKALKETGLDAKTLKDKLKEFNANGENKAESYVKAGETAKESLENYITEFRDGVDGSKSILEQISNIKNSIGSATGTTSADIDNADSIFGALKGYNKEKLFEQTANGIQVNTRELSKMMGALKTNDIKNFDSQLSSLKDRYAQVSEEIAKASVGSEQYNNLIGQRDKIAQQINDVQMLKTQYEGLTSSFSKWQTAMSGSEKGDTYDYATQNKKEMDELYKKGLVGTEKFRSYVQTMTDKDVSNWDTDKIVNMYKKGKPVMDRYFQDESQGVKNFLNDLQKIGQAQEKNGKWKFDINDSEAAQKLGTSTEVVQQMVNKLNDYGFKVKVGMEPDTDNLSTVKDKTTEMIKEVAENTKGMTTNELNNIFGDGNLNFNLGSEEEVQKTIDKLTEAKNNLEESGDTDSGLYNALVKATEQANTLKEAIAGSKAELNEPNYGGYDMSNQQSQQVAQNGVNYQLGVLQNGKDTDNRYKQAFSKESLKSENIDLSNIGKMDSSQTDEALSKIEAKLNKLKENGSINLKTKGANEAVTIFATLERHKLQLQQPVLMSINTSNLSGAAASGLKKVQEFVKAKQELDTIKTVEKKYGITVDDSKAKASLESAKKSLQNMSKDEKKEVGITVTGQDSVESVSKKIANIKKTNDVYLNLKGKADDAEKKKKNLTKEKSVSIKMNATGNAKSTYDSFKGKTVTITYKSNDETKPPKNGHGSAQGTFGHGLAQGTFNGQAFAGGTLVGELGQEMVVRGNRYFTVGNNGAEFFNYKKGDIVFNHKQTEALIKNGKTGTRGKAYVNGNVTGLAFSSGTGGFYGGAASSSSSKKKKSSSSSKSKSNSHKSKSKSSKKNKKNNKKKSKKGTTETFDWIERKLKSIEDALSKVGSLANNVYNSWGTRNNYLSQQLSKTRTEINAQKQAAKSYQQAANKVGLSASWRKKVESGNYSVQDIKDEKLIKKINKYRELYDKAQAASLKARELERQNDELLAQQFENYAKEYEEKIQVLDNAIAKSTANMNLKSYNADVRTISTISDLNSQMANQKNKLSLLRSEYSKLNSTLNSGNFKNGGANAIAQYSEGWYQMKDKLDNVGKQIIETETAIAETQKKKAEEIKSAYESQMETLTSMVTRANDLMDISQKKGMLTSTKYYETLISLSKQQNYLKQREKDALESQIVESIKNGTLKIYSKEWYNLKKNIDDVANSQADAIKKQEEWNQKIKEVSWDMFDRILDDYKDFAEELDFISDIFDKQDKQFNKNGSITEKGTATLGIYASKYDLYAKSVKNYSDEIAKLDKQYENDKLNTSYLKRRDTLLKGQRDAIKNIENEKQSIKKLIKEGYEKQLSYMEELISKRKEALSDQKDAYDYQKKIKKQVEETTRYQKQLMAFGGDTSEEGKKNAQKAAKNLKDSQEDLREMQWSKYIDDTKDMLDNLKNDFKDWIDDRMENLEEIVSNAFDTVNEKQDSIEGTLSEFSEKSGYVGSEALNMFLSEDMKNIPSLVASYGQGVSNIANTTTDILAVLNAIAGKVNTMQTEADQQAKVDTSTVTQNSTVLKSEAATKSYNDAQAQAAAKAAAEAKAKADAQARAKAAAQARAKAAASKKSASSSSNGVPNLTGKKYNDLRKSGAKKDYTTVKDSGKASVWKKYKGKSVKMQSGTTGHIDTNGHIVYNVGDQLRRWNPDNGKVDVWNYNKKQFEGFLKSWANTKNEVQDAREAHKKKYGHFFKGGLVEGYQNILQGSGDDTVTINTLKQGEAVFDVKTTRILQKFNEQSSNLDYLMSNRGNSVNTAIDNINLNIALPNVTDYKTFKNELIKDRTFNNAVVDIVDYAMNGGNSLSTRKHIK